MMKEKPALRPLEGGVRQFTFAKTYVAASRRPSAPDNHPGRTLSCRRRCAAYMAFLAALALWSVLLAGCKNVSAPEVVKIGLIAPFEGPSRSLGYDTLNGVKLRLKLWNESDAQPKIELVALNDDSDPVLAARLPVQLAQDPDVRIILGPPQGHTAMAALPELAQSGIPTILLAPVRSAPSDTIVAYAGLGAHYQKLFRPMLGLLPPAWSRPIKQPVLWLGDPLTLAETLTEHPELIPAAGSVADEEAFQKWAPALAWSIPWAAPVPDDLPQSFAFDYEEMTGKKPALAAALAYAATDQALRILAEASDHRPGPEELRTIPTPPITLINTHLMQ